MIEDAVRIDKWLWAARFFKTRSLASQAVTGGKVHVAGERVKPSRGVRIGDSLRITRGATQWEVVVAGLESRRGPATVAATLYEETPQSIVRRTSEAERERQKAARRASGLGRPTKRERRELERFKTG